MSLCHLETSAQRNQKPFFLLPFQPWIQQVQLCPVEENCHEKNSNNKSSANLKGWSTKKRIKNGQSQIRGTRIQM